MSNDYEIIMFGQIFVEAAREVLKNKSFGRSHVDVSKVKDLMFGSDTIVIKTDAISGKETVFKYTSNKLYAIDGCYNLQQKMIEDIQKCLESNIKNINHVDSKEKEVCEDGWVLDLIAGVINVELLYGIGGDELSKTNIGVGMNPHEVSDMVYVDLNNPKAENHFSVRCNTIKDLIEMGCCRAATGIISKKLDSFVEEVNKNGKNDEKPMRLRKINNPSKRDELLNMARTLGCDKDGDIIYLDGKKYLVDVLSKNVYYIK